MESSNKFTLYIILPGYQWSKKYGGRRNWRLWLENRTTSFMRYYQPHQALLDLTNSRLIHVGHKSIKYPGARCSKDDETIFTTISAQKFTNWSTFFVSFHHQIQYLIHSDNFTIIVNAIYHVKIELKLISAGNLRTAF